MKPVATEWFQHERLHSLVTDYLAGRRAPGCPALA
jgi:hypothetical protein